MLGLIFVVSLISLFSIYLFFRFETLYFSRFKEIYRQIGYGFLIDKTRIIFLLTVVFVTCLVSLFSESYMEHYNSKKFFFLILSFFFSIILLVHSSRFLTFFIGWDGLGLSSICLIMFYPNKITLYNSFLTIIFNRIGDVIFIFIFCFFLINLSSFILILDSNYGSIFFLLTLLCRFTKRAQFPLSRWLPAAISAPTPISAIVHSSTLVTAGVYIVHKLGMYFSAWGLSSFFLFFRFVTFILGGVMANIELDFKKIVAFSTISQISMIIFFCSLGLFMVGLFHTMLHAFFKTLLFCVSGVFFILFFRDQFKLHFFSFKGIDFLRLFLLLSVYRITGLIFRSSFATKDLVLEFVGARENFLYFFIIFRRLFTLFYCCKLFRVIISGSYLFSVIRFKRFFSRFWLIFRFLTLLGGVFLFKVFLVNLYVVVSWFDILLILRIFSVPFLTRVKFSSKVFFFLTLRISFIKNFSFSVYGRLMKFNFLSSVLSSEKFFLKNFYIRGLKNFFYKFRLRMYNIYFFLIFLFCFF